MGSLTKIWLVFPRRSDYRACFDSPALQTILLTYLTSTVLTARNARLVALAVLLHAPRLPTAAPLQIDPICLRVCHHSRHECIHIALQQQLLCFLAFLLMLLHMNPPSNRDQIVETADAIASVAVNVGRETFAIKLQTARFPTVTGMCLLVTSFAQRNGRRNRCVILLLF